MPRCFLLTVFVLYLVSCSSPTATPTPVPQATYTPLPTYTPYPTFTPISQPTSQVVARPMSTATLKPTTQSQATASASVSPSASTSTCIAWTDAADHMNETTCVRGTVYSASQNGSTFFINFDSTRTSFYAVSFNYTWDNLKGKCVEISGKIVPYNGRPEIVINKQDQLKMCP